LSKIDFDINSFFERYTTSYTPLDKSLGEITMTYLCPTCIETKVKSPKVLFVDPISPSNVGAEGTNIVLTKLDALPEVVVVDQVLLGNIRGASSNIFSLL
jgi:hypothetical protein